MTRFLNDDAADGCNSTFDAREVMATRIEREEREQAVLDYALALLRRSEQRTVRKRDAALLDDAFDQEAGDA